MGFRTRLVLILLTVLVVALGAMLVVALVRGDGSHTDKDDSDVNSNTSSHVAAVVVGPAGWWNPVPTHVGGRS